MADWVLVLIALGVFDVGVVCGILTRRWWDEHLHLFFDPPKYPFDWEVEIPDLVKKPEEMKTPISSERVKVIGAHGDLTFDDQLLEWKSALAAQ